MTLIVPKYISSLTACAFTEANGKIPTNSIVAVFIKRENKIQP